MPAKSDKNNKDDIQEIVKELTMITESEIKACSEIMLHTNMNRHIMGHCDKNVGPITRSHSSVVQ